MQSNAAILSRFEADLRARINPENSRRFNPQRLFASQKTLTAIVSQDWLSPQALRISVVGSNGKGSTAFYLAAQAALGQETIGLFTSPHLLYVLERICIKDQNQELAPVIPSVAWEGMCALKKQFPEHYHRLSYFEILTLLALHLFRKNNCRLQIYEAGLGGRFDATRAAQAQAVILTPIVKEHTQILGTEPGQILKEKLGILSKNTHSLFCTPQPYFKKKEIESLAAEIAPQVKVFFYEEAKANSETKNPLYLEENQAFASFVLETLSIPYETKPDLAVPGRLERRNVILGKGQTKQLIFDVAHNPAAIARTLADLLQKADPHSYCQTSLVLLALLSDRPTRLCLTAIQKAGITNIWQLIGENWAAPESRSKVQAVPADELTPRLAKELRSHPLERVIFLGTHRSYSYFVDLQEHLTKEMVKNS